MQEEEEEDRGSRELRLHVGPGRVRRAAEGRRKRKSEEMRGREESRVDREKGREIKKPSGDHFTGWGEVFLERGWSQTDDRAKWVATPAHYRATGLHQSHR